MTTINTDLDLLIMHLEKERKSLKKMIKASQSELENLIVYYHSEELIQIDHKLDTLYSFRDPFYHQKERLNRQIKFFKQTALKKDQIKSNQHLKKLYAERINKATAELQNLIDIPGESAVKSSRHIDDALLALHEKRYKSFKIIIWEDDGTTLHFKKKKDQLIVLLNRQMDFGEADFVITGRVQQPLKGLGFEYNEQQKKYFLSFTFVDNNDIKQIKMWLSRFLKDYWNISGSISLIYE